MKQQSNKAFISPLLKLLSNSDFVPVVMPPFEEEGYIVLLMSVGRSVGRPDGFR